jgi:hypothetical protein
MSRRLFSRRKSPPSFYALRHAASAELKAAGLTQEEIARGMGHASELSQKAYGMRSQGPGGYEVKAEASMPVRVAAKQSPLSKNKLAASKTASSTEHTTSQSFQFGHRPHAA